MRVRKGARVNEKLEKSKSKPDFGEKHIAVCLKFSYHKLRINKVIAGLVLVRIEVGKSGRRDDAVGQGEHGSAFLKYL